MLPANPCGELAAGGGVTSRKSGELTSLVGCHPPVPPPASRPAKPYKQFLITLSAIFPLTVAVPWLLQPLFQWAPLLGLPVIRQLLIAALIVGTMVYIVMPRYTRLVARWLFR